MAAPVTAYVYDKVGNLLSETDPLGHESDYVYDSRNRHVQTTDPELGVTSYTYDAAGNTLSLTDPDDNTTSWTYDNLNRVTAETDPLSHSTLYQYDADGEVTQKTDRDGRVTQYVYDNVGDLTAELWKDGSTTVRTIGYTYDAAGEMLSPSDPSASYTYAYNNLGRVTSTAASIAGLTPAITLTNWYDAAGNRASLEAQVGNSADFFNLYYYDHLGRLTGIDQSSQYGGDAVAPKRVDFAYNADGQFSTIARYATISNPQLVAQTTYTYDAASRLTSLAHTQGETTLAGYTWTYDSAGRITQSASTTDGTVDYSYDTTDQLTGADYTSSQTDESYSYDSNGNRTNTGYSTGTRQPLVVRRHVYV